MPKAAAPKSKARPKPPPPPPPPTYSFSSLVQEYALFLEITIQSLLHIRSIYPSESFLHRNKTWGAPAVTGKAGSSAKPAESVQCWASRNEAVREFVGKSVHKGMDDILDGRGNRVVLVLLRDRETPLERWIFTFDDLLGLGAKTDQNRHQLINNGPTSQSLASSFKNAYVQAVTIAGTLGALDLTEDSQFTILVEHPVPAGTNPDAADREADGASSHTLATDSASLRRREGLVQAPDRLSTEASEREGPDAYRSRWVKDLMTGILDMSISVQEIVHEEAVPMEVDYKGKGRATD